MANPVEQVKALRAAFVVGAQRHGASLEWAEGFAVLEYPWPKVKRPRVENAKDFQGAPTRFRISMGCIERAYLHSTNGFYALHSPSETEAIRSVLLHPEEQVDAE